MRLWIVDGRRGGWEYGSLNCPDLGKSTWRIRLSEAGYIADHCADLVDRVSITTLRPFVVHSRVTL